MALAEIFIPRARRLAEATGTRWPSEYEQASVSYFERSVGVRLALSQIQGLAQWRAPDLPGTGVLAVVREIGRTMTGTPWPFPGERASCLVAALVLAVRPARLSLTEHGLIIQGMRRC